MVKNEERYAWKVVPVKSIAMVRKEVRAFGEAMERNLRANDDKGGWDGCRVGFLVACLRAEIAEFLSAVGDGSKCDPGRVVSEAADVANYLMMICDRLGAFQEKSEGEFIIFHTEGDGDET